MICLVSISHYSISTQCVTSCTGRLSSFGVAWCHVVRVVQDAIAAVEEGTADAAQERIVEARLAGAEAGSRSQIAFVSRTQSQQQLPHNDFGVV
jgi:hypothetical protein